jgi:hydroxyacylglutathione hydrolase
MPQQIKTINFGGVNCYLVKAGNGYILIDTGFPSKRAALEKELECSGCQRDNLKLVLITHGDLDHAGNCAYLREKYGVKIAMHTDDSGMVERGDMHWNRKAKPDKFSTIFRVMSLMAPLFKPGKFETFKPDLTIDEAFALSPYGFDAKVLHLPGHSKGSLGILTADGDLFCGDLLYNIFGKPGIRFIDDLADYNVSIEKLKKLSVKTVYPGHGKPFLWEQFLKKNR